MNCLYQLLELVSLNFLPMSVHSDLCCLCHFVFNIITSFKYLIHLSVNDLLHIDLIMCPGFEVPLVDDGMCNIVW